MKHLNFGLVAGVMFSLLAGGCAGNSGRLNRVALNMPRTEVLKVLGRPHSVSAQGDTEYLNYNLIAKGVGDRREYSIRLVNGRVESFAEKADYGPARLAPQTPLVKAASITSTNTPAGVSK
jgi:hypothetical protein